MSCTELGFDDYGSLRLNKSVDLEATFPAPSSYDFTGYTGDFQIRLTSDAASALLTVTEVANGNGSILTFDGSNITILIKAADIAALPDAAAPADDWVGVYQWVNTDPDGLVTEFCAGSVAVEKGVVR